MGGLVGGWVRKVCYGITRCISNFSFHLKEMSFHTKFVDIQHNYEIS